MAFPAGEQQTKSRKRQVINVTHGTVKLGTGLSSQLLGLLLSLRAPSRELTLQLGRSRVDVLYERGCVLCQFQLSGWSKMLRVFYNVLSNSFSATFGLPPAW